MAATATQPKTHLYELADQYTFLAVRYLSVMEAIEEAEGEITESQETLLAEITRRLEEILDGAEDKVLNLARLIVQNEAEAAALKGEEDRIAQVAAGLAKRRKRIEKSNEFFKSYILGNLERMGLDKVQDGHTAVSVRRSESVEVLDPKKVPFSYIRRVTAEVGACAEASRTKLMLILEESGIPHSEDVDKVEAKKDLKAGIQISGLELKTNRSLRIS